MKRQMAISEFKAKALEVLKYVGERRGSIVVTKHGKPIAQVVPVDGVAPRPGSLAHTLIHEGDVVSPLGAEAWESTRR